MVYTTAAHPIPFDTATKALTWATTPVSYEFGAGPSFAHDTRLGGTLNLTVAAFEQDYDAQLMSGQAGIIAQNDQGWGIQGDRTYDRIGAGQALLLEFGMQVDLIRLTLATFGPASQSFDIYVDGRRALSRETPPDAPAGMVEIALSDLCGRQFALVGRGETVADCGITLCGLAAEAVAEHGQSDSGRGVTHALGDLLAGWAGWAPRSTRTIR
ncbi:hypothetical protein [Actibacterium sp. 188UL27-1]|uniref:hypothetical protein n=1 Tax=Actibacterium sp. 188UL27-1 TaxID=2786961 RepID=UPI00195D7ED2|nr:hypothetical protein [Actibacterium sp. 188UL27-1]MBM7067918.1 hypothetical protein [Actibacterium sp. 188UL27-1]